MAAPDVPAPDVPQGPPRQRRLLPWLVLVALVWVVAGPILAGIAAGVAVWHLALHPPPRHLLFVAVVLFAAVPVAWVLGNAERLDTVSPQLVTQNRWPSVLAATALLLLVLGVVREVRTVAPERTVEPAERTTP